MNWVFESLMTDTFWLATTLVEDKAGQDTSSCVPFNVSQEMGNA